MRSKITAILSDIRPEFDFNDSISNFIEAGMLDSFDLVTLVTSLDEVFEISIDGTDIVPENFSNIEAILNLLNKYVK
jgi:acyl carrier protein